MFEFSGVEPGRAKRCSKFHGSDRVGSDPNGMDRVGSERDGSGPNGTGRDGSGLAERFSNLTGQVG